MRFDEPIRWPNGARCAVMLTFDVDAEFVWLAWKPGLQNRPKTLAIGQYGPRRGMERILRVLDRFGVKASFFVVGKVAELYPGPIQEAAHRGHEIAHHGYEHENFGLLGLDQQRAVLVRGIDALRAVTGNRPVGYRTPAGEMTDETLRLLLDHGFSWTSFMRGDDRPYFVEVGGQVTGLVEIPAHWELDDFPFFMYTDDPPFPPGQSRIASFEHVFDIWASEFDGYYAYGLCYVIMFHPQTIGTPGRIGLLERLLTHLTARPGVWFTTGSELAEFWRRSGRPNDPRR